VAAQWHMKSKKGTEVLVQPAVHPSKLLKGHNIVTLLFWVTAVDAAGQPHPQAGP